jgi:uncharacterized protein
MSEIRSQNLARLREIVRSLESAVVAYSGGVDSALLLKVAHEELGDRSLALTAISPSLAVGEREEAVRFARDLGARHVLVNSSEMEIPAYTANPNNRCYFCKTEVFRLCREHAEEQGFRWVIEGTHADDLTGHRPGARAAREAGVRWPLVEAEMGKKEVRAAAKELALPAWDKPSMACLASRFPTGTAITTERLGQVEGCESFLREHGFRHYRVRYHHDLARVEVGPSEMGRLVEGDLRDRFLAHCALYGFERVALDLAGYPVGEGEV